MKKIFMLCLGLIALGGTSSLFAQIGNFETVNLRNAGQITNAAVFDVDFSNLDLSLDVRDDYRIQLGESTTPTYEIEFDGFAATDAFRVSRLANTSYIALVRPNGENNNLGHLESGTYGNIVGTSKWLGLGSAPAAAGPSVYGLRTQWEQNFGIFNLLEVNATTRDLVIAWGGTTSNNRLLFNYSNDPLTPPTTVMQIDSGGDVTIGNPRPAFISDDQLYVRGRIGLGSAEWIEDGGANTISTQATFIPSTDNIRDLGSGANRWDDVFATNPVIQTSDRRMKENIEDMDYGLEEIMQLRPVTYTWKDNERKGLQMGLIAQEVLEVTPEVVYQPSKDMVQDEKGNWAPAGDENGRLGMRYTNLIPVLINGMKEQQSIIEQQNQRIDELEAAIANGGLKQGQGSSDLRLPALYQNNPNPFRETTEIRYFLPETTQEATLYVYNMQGTPVLELQINERGEAVQVIDGGLLESGMYLYALIADGQEVDVKRMILTK